MIAVVKVGSSSVTADTVARLCTEIATTRRDGHTVVVVTSGAIAAGWAALERGEQRPGDLAVLQAVSAVGQHRLMRLWRRARAPRADSPGRCCWRRSTSCTASSTSTRARPCSACSSSAWCRWSTRTTPWPTTRSASATTTGSPRSWPTWSAAAARAAHRHARACSRADPRLDPEASLIEEVVEIDHELERVAGGPGRRSGSGGMASKLAAAKIATWSGVRRVIADAARPGRVDGRAGRRGPGVGTVFRARESRLSARKLWIAFARRRGGHLTWTRERARR